MIILRFFKIIVVIAILTLLPLASFVCAQGSPNSFSAVIRNNYQDGKNCPGGLNTDAVKWAVKVGKNCLTEGEFTPYCTDAGPITITPKQSQTVTCAPPMFPQPLEGPHCLRVSWCGVNSLYDYRSDSLSAASVVCDESSLSCSKCGGQWWPSRETGPLGEYEAIGVSSCCGDDLGESAVQVGDIYGCCSIEHDSFNSNGECSIQEENTPTASGVTIKAYGLPLSDNIPPVADPRIVLIQPDDPGASPYAPQDPAKAAVDIGWTVSFDGSGSSDPDGTITKYSWDFGDGTTANGALTDHSYSTETIYTVKLRVEDDLGGWSDNRVTIEVNSTKAESERSSAMQCAPSYAPEEWEDEAVKKNNNCYNYALDIKTDHPLNPGELSGNIYTREMISCEFLTTMAEADGLVFLGVSGGECTGCSYKAALAVNPNGPDYHWLRQDNNGEWSYKWPRNSVSNLDSEGAIITDPENSGRGLYTQFCGYFCVDKTKLKNNEN